MSRLGTGFGYEMNIYVGPSQHPTKEITLPYEGMFVEPEPINVPRNPLKNQWRDKQFKVEVKGKKLVVEQEDTNRGWDLNLVVKAFYSKEVLPTHSHEFQARLQKEGSVVTIRLAPNQKIRCSQKALIFKEDVVEMTAAKVVSPTRPGMRGVLKGSISTINDAINDHGIKSSVSGDGDDKESDCISEFQYTSNLDNEDSSGVITLGVQFPSKILHLNLGEYGNRIFFREGLNIAFSVDVEIVDSPDFMDQFQSFVGHGDIFLKVGPTMKQRILKEKEAIEIREDCLLAFTQDINYINSSVQKMENLSTSLFSGKSGLAYRKLVGPGLVWLDYRQSNIIVDRINEDEELSVTNDNDDDDVQLMDDDMMMDDSVISEDNEIDGSKTSNNPS
eukprot:CAMPEP_0194080162 /NCGR_PEP_ID=MMETSP0149-20130528/6225_1 /TAXON_ID=122233 /ORGANISM="Chaetoceros debilis, Strain MM31A-1" /LENGTH=388 /DNA_ID=CAMNT_0038761809 /DNA_START=108 /DNA_END=1274 /DNA_ORIENTATION=+